jgi:hypothetical protein
LRFQAVVFGTHGILAVFRRQIKTAQHDKRQHDPAVPGRSVRPAQAFRDSSNEFDKFAVLFR